MHIKLSYCIAWYISKEILLFHWKKYSSYLSEEYVLNKIFKIEPVNLTLDHKVMPIDRR